MLSVLLRAVLKTRLRPQRSSPCLIRPPSRCGLSVRSLPPSVSPPAWAFTRFPTDPPSRMGRASFGPLAYALPGRPWGWRCWYSGPWPVFPWPSPPSVILFYSIENAKSTLLFSTELKRRIKNHAAKDGAIRGVPLPVTAWGSVAGLTRTKIVQGGNRTHVKWSRGHERAVGTQ